MKLIARFCLIGLLCYPALALAERDPWKGWKPLVETLQEDGIPIELLTAIYQSPEMPSFGDVSFRLAPKESAAMYGGFTTPEKIARAKACIKTYTATFDGVERVYEVPASVIVAIMLVETDLGKNLGKELVVNRLSRIANIATPENLKWNTKRLQEADPTVTYEAVEKRAQYLTTTFYPQLVDLLHAQLIGDLNAQTLKGSIAGAFGIPQFLPSSYLQYGIDGNRNGVASLFEFEDAIWSIGHFLYDGGWRKTIDYEGKRAVIWKYNKSDAYIDTILKVATLVKNKK